MDYAVNPALMGDKPGHREQSLHAENSMYFSPRDTCIQISHQLQRGNGFAEFSAGSLHFSKSHRVQQG